MLESKQIKRPIFVKEFIAENSQLVELLELDSKLKPSSKKEMVERDIAFLKHGIEGEKNVAFELKNAFLPILCPHDIRLEFEGYVAQFDFIVISSKFICILETKKLNGDIEITRDGDFIRTIKGYNGRFIKKEGMYSPISQNERHTNILKEVLTKEKLIATLPVISLVVMANPKTILNKDKCSKAIQASIFKYDQIITFLKRRQEDKAISKGNLELNMYKISDYLLENNKPLKMDYLAKYGLSDDDFAVVKHPMAQSINEVAAVYSVGNEVLRPVNKVVERSVNKSSINNSIPNSNGKIAVIAALKKYRLETSRVERIKPYMVFTDAQLESLIDIKPRYSKELLRVKGFGEKKVTKYGDAILRIIRG